MSLSNLRPLIHRRALALGLSAWATLAVAGYDPVSERGTDLTGTWKLNVALSDDAERMLAQKLDEERKRYARWRRQQESAHPPGAPTTGAEPAGAPPPVARNTRQSAWQKRRVENFRKMLAITKTLSIDQTGATIEITSAVESRRVQAGSRTQVSMPEGELADSNVGWKGEWFVIYRKVRRGPRVTEKYRVLKKTGQLEYLMSWSGDHELSGLEVRRVFDRISGEVIRPDPRVGPVR